jgi:hypothetical protein
MRRTGLINPAVEREKMIREEGKDEADEKKKRKKKGSEPPKKEEE